MNKKVQINEDNGPLEWTLVSNDKKPFYVANGEFALEMVSIEAVPRDSQMEVPNGGYAMREVRDYLRVLDKQIVQLTLKYPGARRFCIASSYEDDNSLSFLRPLTAFEKKAYLKYLNAVAERKARLEARAQAKAQSQALKFLEKHPETLVKAIKEAKLDLPNLIKDGVLKPVNKKGTKTGRVSSKVKVTSNTPKANEVDPYLEGIMNR